MYYSEYRKKENQWDLVQAQKLETQSNLCDAAIIFLADRITHISEVNQQSSSRNRKERNNLIQWMEVEMGKKGNWISQYNNTLAEEERIKVINNPYKPKMAFIDLRRELCGSFGVYWCELWTETHCVIFISPVVNYCHYACGNTTVTVRSIHVMCRYSPSFPTIYNYCHYTCGSTTVTVRSIHFMYRYSPSLPTIYNYCHSTCGSTTVTVRSIHVMYRYSPSLPTIYNYHPINLNNPNSTA